MRGGTDGAAAFRIAGLHWAQLNSGRARCSILEPEFEPRRRNMPIDWLVSTNQSAQGAALSAGVSHAKAGAEQARSEMQRYKEELDRLSLVCRAMWSLLQDTSGLTEQDLMRRMEEVDLQDGQRDGRVRPKVVVCSSCGRNNNGRHTACLYCEMPIERESAFD
jgi:ribosomal protein L32